MTKPTNEATPSLPPSSATKNRRAIDLDPISITHEWIEPVGGAEQVVEQMLKLFPAAQLSCLWNDAPDRFSVEPAESWLSTPPLRGKKAASLPFMTSGWKQLSKRATTRVLATSHSFGHHYAYFTARRDIPSYAYIHTPARYLWAPEVENRGTGRGTQIAAKALRLWDRNHTTERVSYAANSNYIQSRIERSWGMEAQVIYPPVDTERIIYGSPWVDRLAPEEAALFETLPKEFILAASRLVGYKRVDQAMDIANLMGVPLVVAGNGPAESQLREQAAAQAVPVLFIGRTSDALLFALYERALFYSFTAVEDFGIMPVEAVAAGGRVLVASDGGARESAETTGGGVALESFDEDVILKSVNRLMALDTSLSPGKTLVFSQSAFADNVSKWIGPPE